MKLMFLSYSNFDNPNVNSILKSFKDAKVFFESSFTYKDANKEQNSCDIEVVIEIFIKLMSKFIKTKVPILW